MSQIRSTLSPASANAIVVPPSILSGVSVPVPPSTINVIVFFWLAKVPSTRVKASAPVVVTAEYSSVIVIAPGPLRSCWATFNTFTESWVYSVKVSNDSVTE